MSYLVGLIVFAVGLAAGSFINVLAMRYQAGHKLFAASVVSGRSYCDVCGKILRWYELLPLLSFVIQLGKCRSCRAKITWRHPIIEMLSGLLAVSVVFRLYDFFQAWQYRIINVYPWWFFAVIAIWLLTVYILLLISLIDLKFSIIPDQLNLSLFFLGLFYIIIQKVYHLFGSIQGSFLGHHALIFGLRKDLILNHLLGLAVGVGVFGLIILLSRGRAMGMGDLKLIGVLGLLFGWPDIILIVILSFVIGAIWSAFVLVKGKKGLKDMVPFGPFISLGAVIVFLFGFNIMQGYFSLFSLL